MTDGGRPSAVRRFLLRPWLWVGLVIAAAPAINWIDHQSRRTPLPGPDSLRLQAVVERRHGVEVDLSYDHPVTGQRVEASAPRRGRVVEAGARVDIAVDPVDPERVRLAGDQPDESTFDLVSVALLLVLPVTWAAMRHWSVQAAGRVAARPDTPSFAMVGALAAPRRPGRRPSLHLWPLDAAAQSEALCAVPVLVTAGLPVGVAFPVEVKGSPRSFGRVVARAGPTVLWPAARALRSPWLARPDQVAATPPWLPAAAGDQPANRPGRPETSFVVAFWPFVGALAASVAIVATVAGVTLVRLGQANRLYRHGTEVMAEIAEQGESTVAVTYHLPGDATARTGHVPVDWPDEQTVGLRLPAVVDPSQPGRLRFLRERYDAGEPIAWAALPCVAFGALVLTQVRRWRRSAAVAAGGQWHRVSAHRLTRRGFTYLRLNGPAGTIFEVRLPPESTWRLPGWNPGQPLPMEVAGEMNPGSPVAVRHQDRLLPLTSPALMPRSDHPDVPPPPHGAPWPAPRPGPGPALP